jgi:hypothetical protein
LEKTQQTPDCSHPLLAWMEDYQGKHSTIQAILLLRVEGKKRYLFAFTTTLFDTRAISHRWDLYQSQRKAGCI